ncbi:MAG: dUTP diphosphatase [Spirochaetota bacterium]
MVSLDCCLLAHGAGIPGYASAFAAGADLRAALAPPYKGSLLLPVGQTLKVPTALQIALPLGYEAQVRPRSGLAAKHGLTVLNAPGTIDPDYRGEIFVLLINHGEEDFLIRHGDRIAQLVIAPVIQVHFRKVEVLPETERGSGGFGSSGMH